MNFCPRDFRNLFSRLFLVRFFVFVSFDLYLKLLCTFLLFFYCLDRFVLFCIKKLVAVKDLRMLFSGLQDSVAKQIVTKWRCFSRQFLPGRLRPAVFWRFVMLYSYEDKQICK